MVAFIQQDDQSNEGCKVDQCHLSMKHYPRLPGLYTAYTLFVRKTSNSFVPDNLITRHRLSTEVQQQTVEELLITHQELPTNLDELQESCLRINGWREQSNNIYNVTATRLII